MPDKAVNKLLSFLQGMGLILLGWALLIVVQFFVVMFFNILMDVAPNQKWIGSVLFGYIALPASTFPSSLLIYLAAKKMAREIHPLLVWFLLVQPSILLAYTYFGLETLSSLNEYTCMAWLVVISGYLPVLFLKWRENKKRLQKDLNSNLEAKQKEVVNI